MSKIVFFSIPAYGHTNPTIQVVSELTSKGHEVWYYSFNEFKSKIENAGGKFISCDNYLPKEEPDYDKKVGKDFSALIEMVVDTTLSLEEKVCRELTEIEPDCIVSDSMCFWGKLFAKKMNIKYICSTTTFAFNKDTAKMMKQGLSEVMKMILGMRRINKKLSLLREKGYEVKNLISLIENNNDTNTIVYTSKEFQPMVESFSDKYSFIGPSVLDISVSMDDKNDKRIYISLGTVNNKNIDFYKNCIEALRDYQGTIIMSVGSRTKVEALGDIPNNFIVENTVDQIKVLQSTDLFITHCGMNSVNESLYYGVPMVLFPQHSEQGLVAKRVSDLGAGVKLKKNNSKGIKEAVKEIMNNYNYKNNAEIIGESFKKAGGAKRGAEIIIDIIKVRGE